METLFFESLTVEGVGWQGRHLCRHMQSFWSLYVILNVNNQARQAIKGVFCLFYTSCSLFCLVVMWLIEVWRIFFLSYRHCATVRLSEAGQGKRSRIYCITFLTATAQLRRQKWCRLRHVFESVNQVPNSLTKCTPTNGFFLLNIAALFPTQSLVKLNTEFVPWPSIRFLFWVGLGSITIRLVPVVALIEAAGIKLGKRVKTRD